MEQAPNPGYVVTPLTGGTPMFAVVSPDGEIISMHLQCAAALSKVRRLNRKLDGR